MEQRNEPTTAEIVRALRCDGCDGMCSECFFGYEEKDSIGYETWCCRRDELDGIAADRLESQEQTIATMRGDSFDAISVTNVLAYLDTVIGLIHCADGIKDLIVSMQGTAIELTARAEKAEAERDAAVAEIKESYAFSTREDGEPIYDFALCLICAKKDKPECDCTSSVGSEFEWRGLRGKGDA